MLSTEICVPCYDAQTQHGGPSMMPAMGPPLPGTMPVVSAPEMRPLVGDYKAVKTTGPMLVPFCLARLSQTDKRGGLSFFLFFF